MVSICDNDMHHSAMQALLISKKSSTLLPTEIYPMYSFSKKGENDLRNAIDTLS